MNSLMKHRVLYDSTSPFPLLDLPDDLRVYLLSRLPLVTVLTVSLLNYEWYLLSQSGTIWKSLCKTELGITFLNQSEEVYRKIFGNHKNWKQIFLHLYVQNLKRSYHDKSQDTLGCVHYPRNCQIRAQCCQEFFPCRVCHDDTQDHLIDRFATDTMMCMKCFAIQQAAKVCANPTCEALIAHYYCDRCKLWTDARETSIYHCDKCGLCRLGKGLGIDNWHCDTCGICLSMKFKENHECRVKDGLKTQCPVCNKKELVFFSRDPIVLLPCGHGLHFKCFSLYLSQGNHNNRCPLCVDRQEQDNGQGNINDNDGGGDDVHAIEMME